MYNNFTFLIFVVLLTKSKTIMFNSNDFLNSLPSFSEGAKPLIIKDMSNSSDKGFERNDKTLDLLIDSGTNWKVNDYPLSATDKDGIILPTTSRGLFRSDNNANLGVVGSRYEVMQNDILAETMVDLQSQFGGKLGGGALQEGKKVFYQLSLSDAKIGDYANNTLKRHITTLNSHDGSSSIGFGSSNTAIICSNTFYMAMRDLQKFRHTASANDRLQQAIVGFEKALQGEEAMIDNYTRMASAELKGSDELIKMVFNQVLGVKKGATIDDVSTQKKNKAELFSKAFRMEMEEKGATLWGLFNAVTRYTNHMDRTGGKDLNYLMSGGGYKKNLDAYNTITKWLNEPTRSLIAV